MFQKLHACGWYGCVVIVRTVERLYLKMTQCELRLMSVYASSLIQQQRSDFLTSDLQDAKIMYAREMLCQFCNYFCTHIWFLDKTILFFWIGYRCCCIGA